MMKLACLLIEIRELEGPGYSIQYLKQFKKQMLPPEYDFLMNIASRGEQ